MSDNPILKALYALDVTNDNHWTDTGLPRVESVRFNAADQTLTRDQITEAAPGFTRQTAAGYALTGTPVANTEQKPPEIPAAGPAGAESGSEQGATPSPLGDGAGAAPQGEKAAPGGSGTGDGKETPPEQPEVEGSDELDEPDEASEVEAALEKTRQRIDELRREVDLLTEEINKLAQEEQTLHSLLLTLKPATSNIQAIQAYLDRQKQNLQLRAERMRMIRESGINLKELANNLKAPVDAVRARKKGR